MEKRYIAALDQGTTSSRCILFDREQNMVGMAQKEFTQFYPKPGWVEHDPMEIWSSQYGVLMETLAQSGVDVHELAGIGITNQRETAIVWDRDTGRPVYNAIVWQCRRTAGLCEELKQDPAFVAYVKDRTGLLIDAYFSATKIRWILDNVPGARERAEEGKLLFGTVDSWLIWKLTGGVVHVTDYTNASRTMLYDIRSLRWDETVCQRLGVPMSMLPQVRSSSEVYGTVNIQGVEVPIAGIAGDQQAALFGQTCFAPAVIQWLRDELGLISDSSDTEYFAGKVADTAGVYVVPAFTGLGAPHWDMNARGAILGLTRGAGRNHIIRAALESIAYQTADVLRAMEEDAGIPLRELRVDGGASANNFLMQFQADLVDRPLSRPKIRETTALGAAYLAGLATGVWKNLEDIRGSWTLDRLYQPAMEGEQRENLLSGWHEAVDRVRSRK